MFSKVLVTGSTGVTGHALREVAHADFPEMELICTRGKELDLTRTDETIRFVNQVKPDAIIHLAAKSGGIGLSMKHPAILLRDNVMMNFNILEAARSAQVKKVIMTLSSGMYPESAPLPLKEDSIHQGPAHPSNYSYSFAKRLVEPTIRAYRTEYQMSVIGLIPNGIFGPFDNFNLNSAPMLPSLIRRFYENREGNTPLVVWGDGSPLREWSFSQDIARIFLWALNHYDDAPVLNIGTTEEHTIKEIAYTIADAMKIGRDRIQFDTTKPGGVFRKSTDNSRFMALSQFKFTPLKEGIEKTVRWFAETYQKNRDLICTEDKH